MVKVCPAKDYKLQNFRAWRNTYLNSLSSVGAKILALMDHCYKKIQKYALTQWDSLIWQ